MASVRYKGFEYEIPGEYTNREMMLIENIAECRAADFYNALDEEGGQLKWGMIVAVSFIAMKRAGAKIPLDELLDADMDAIEFVGDPVPEVTPTDPLAVSGSKIEPEDTSATHDDAGGQP